MIIGFGLRKNFEINTWLDNVFSVVDKLIIGTEEELSFEDKYKDKVVVVDVDGLSQQESRAKLWNEHIFDKCNEQDIIVSVDNDEFFAEEAGHLKKVFDHVKDQNIELISFKRCDMWSEDECRVDGLWSGYYIKAVKYQKVKYEVLDNSELDDLRQSDQRFFPYSFYDKKIVWNSDCRIYSFKLLKEDVKKKTFENVNNLPDRDWIMRAHLKTINNKPELKKVERIIKMPNVRLVIPVISSKLLNEDFYKRVGNTIDKYYGDLKITIIYQTKEEKEVINFFENHKWKNDILELMPVTIMGDDNNPRLIDFALKKSFWQTISDREENYFLIVSSNHPLEIGFIHHLGLSEKKVLIDGREDIGYSYYIEKEFAKKINFNSFEKLTNDVVGIVDSCAMYKVVCWTVGTGQPTPTAIVVNKIFEDEMPAFISAHDDIKSKNFIINDEK